MKKFFKRVIPFALVVVMCLCVAAPAFAAEKVFANIATFSDASASASAVQVPEVIGGLKDQDGILLDDPVLPASVNSTYLFQMTATNVSSLLTTYYAPDKSFTGSCMDAYASEGLRIEGRVTSSTGTGSIKVGACYYKESTDSFVSVAYSYFTSGSNQSEWWPKTGYFNNSMTYYGHITNNLGTGTVSGSLTYSVDTQ